MKLRVTQVLAHLGTEFNTEHAAASYKPCNRIPIIASVATESEHGSCQRIPPPPNCIAPKKVNPRNHTTRRRNLIVSRLLSNPVGQIIVGVATETAKGLCQRLPPPPDYIIPKNYNPPNHTTRIMSVQESHRSKNRTDPRIQLLKRRDKTHILRGIRASTPNPLQITLHFTR